MAKSLTIPPELEGLPGAELVVKGLGDLAAGWTSNEAYLVAMAPSRLRASGLELSSTVKLPDEPELGLYHALGAQGVEDPYGRYNSLRRELDSFMNALEARRQRERPQDTHPD